MSVTPIGDGVLQSCRSLIGDVQARHDNLGALSDEVVWHLRRALVALEEVWAALSDAELVDRLDRLSSAV